MKKHITDQILVKQVFFLRVEGRLFLGGIVVRNIRKKEKFF